MMPRGNNAEIFTIPRIAQVHPKAQYHLRYHNQSYDQDHRRVKSVTSVDYVVRSPSPISIMSSISESSDGADSESESVEIITVQPSAAKPSRLIQRQRTEPIILSPKTIAVPALSYPPYIVTTTTPHSTGIIRDPSKALIVRETTAPEKLMVVQKRPFKCEVKTSTLISLLIAGLVLLSVIATTVIIVLAVFIARRPSPVSFSSRTSLSSACSANCMMELTPFSQPTVASWRLDGSLSDLNNVYPARYTNPPTAPYVDGNMGQAVDFSGSQYLYASTQFMNLSYQSWTIEAWLLITDVNSERGIFGQCESIIITDRCLSLSIKNKRLHLGFNTTELMGTTQISTSTTLWHHVAFVYDYTNMHQSIYWDGVLEATTAASGVSVGPYRGSSGQVTIGWVTGNHFFRGRIDHVSVTRGVKTACQILNDATLTAYYPFDVSGSYLDYSMNVFHGVANELITVAGRVNGAYSFQNALSYFQSMAFTAYEPSEPFSVSLWIKPFYVDGGTLLHLSTGISGSSPACFDLLGFTPAGQIVGRVYKGSGVCCPGFNAADIQGPIIPVNIWSHIVLVYSAHDGLALFINGTLQDVTDPFDSFTGSIVDYQTRPYLTVGNPKTAGSNPTCPVSGSLNLSPGAYQGIIDELRIYSRALTINEICALYHA